MELDTMRNPYRRFVSTPCLAMTTLAAFAIATPASAQFGGLRKKIKPAAGQPANAEAAAPGDPGGMIVLTDDVVNQLIVGLKAGEAEREAAAREETPYGRHKKAGREYAVAQPKCEAAQQTFIQKMSGNQKLADKYTALSEKMVEAQSKQDYQLMAVYQDSAMAMQDPSCIVKEPEQPKDYYEAERVAEARAEEKEIQASGFSRGELAGVKERAIAILRGTEAPGGAAPSEKAAVAAKASQLKPLLGFREQPPVQAVKPVAEASTAPATAQPSPEMSAAASSMSSCMAKNMQNHEAQILALGKRAEAAQAANNTQKLMAIGDTLQQIQMAGCMGQ